MLHVYDDNKSDHDIPEKSFINPAMFNNVSQVVNNGKAIINQKETVNNSTKN